jgi:hypothetical protein
MVMPLAFAIPSNHQVPSAQRAHNQDNQVNLHGHITLPNMDRFVF